jgi:hypothetical protein
MSHPFKLEHNGRWHVLQVRREQRLGDLVHRASSRFLVVTPSDQSRAMTEPAVLDVICADLRYQPSLQGHRLTLVPQRPTALSSRSIACETRTTDRRLQ